VIKKKRGSNDEADRRSQDTDSSSSHPSSPQRRFSTPQPAAAAVDIRDHDVANCAQRLSKHADPGYETVSVNAHSAAGDSSERDPGYETVRRNHSTSEGDPNYEELRVRSEDLPNFAEIDGYQQIQVRSEAREPQYARLSRQQPRTNSEPITEPDYASISREKKCAKNAKTVRTECEDDPGYERVAGAAQDPGYERVKSRKGRENSHYQDSPDYESVRGRNDEGSSSDPGYERVRLASSNTSNQNHTDPNYESLHNDEPNYESVRYISPNKMKERGMGTPNQRSNHLSTDGHHSTNVL